MYLPGTVFFVGLRRHPKFPDCYRPAGEASIQQSPGTEYFNIDEQRPRKTTNNKLIQCQGADKRYFINIRNFESTVEGAGRQ